MANILTNRSATQFFSLILRKLPYLTSYALVYAEPDKHTRMKKVFHSITLKFQQTDFKSLLEEYARASSYAIHR